MIVWSVLEEPCQIRPEMAMWTVHRWLGITGGCIDAQIVAKTRFRGNRLATRNVGRLPTVGNH